MNRDCFLIELLLRGTVVCFALESSAKAVEIINRYNLYLTKTTPDFKEFSNSRGILLRVHSEDFCYDKATAAG